MAKKTKAEKQAELTAGKSIAEIAAQQESVGETVATDVAPASPAEPAKAKAPGKIAQILLLFKSGMSTKDIAKQFVRDENGNMIPTGETGEAGEIVCETFHPTTISIQVNKYKKANPDLYPPQPPAKTKKEIAAEKKAAKEAEAAAIAANAPQPQAEASAVADVQA